MHNIVVPCLHSLLCLLYASATRNINNNVQPAAEASTMVCDKIALNYDVIRADYILFDNNNYADDDG